MKGRGKHGAVTTSLTIESRYCGPPGAGNGGYVAGRFAAFLDAGPDEAVEVTLRAGVPLDTPLVVETGVNQPDVIGSGVSDPVAPDGTPRERNGAADLVAEGAHIAGARVVPFDAAPFHPRSRAPLSFSAASDLADGALLRDPDEHPFPGCFVCGPARAPGDGMRLFPSRVPERSDFAVAWTVGHAGAEYVWAALDCPSSYPMYLSEAPFAGPCVLGRITARVPRTVDVGERCVVMSWREAVAGRKLHTASAVYDEAGKLVAAARATWIRLLS